MEDLVEDSFFKMLESTATSTLPNEEFSFDTLEEVFNNNPSMDSLLDLDLDQPQVGQSLNLLDFSLFDSVILDDVFQTNPVKSPIEMDLVESIDGQITSSSFSEMSAPVTPASVASPSEKVLERTKKSSGRIDKSSKERNKEATQRYRSKKLVEREKLFADVAHYEKLNKQLKEKIEDIQSEVNLIKSLLVQVYLAKKI